MQVAVTHSPSYAMATVLLDEAESILAESGAMVAMSDGIASSISSGGGMGKALARRFLTQESLFLTKFTARSHGAWVSLAPPLPGDVVSVDLPPEGLVIQSGSFLAAAGTVNLDTNFGGAQRMLGKEGAFVVKATGSGETVLASYGGLQRFDLDPGQRLTVDTGHYVASTATMPYKLRVMEGVITAALSKEGLVAVFEGPGSVYAQTRSPVELRSFIFPDRPQNEKR